jgi:membrane protein DedA with SNARE-associated domain
MEEHSGSLTMSIDGLIAHYGLAAIFVVAGTEGEAAAVAGGIVAHRGIIPLWEVAIAVWSGSLLFGQILFLVARRFRDAPWIRKQTARRAYAAVVRALERRPVGYVLVYRFIFGVRTLTPLVLGASRISTARFSVLNAVAAALWAAVFTGLGYGFGKSVEQVFGHLPSMPHLAMIGGVVATILTVVYILHRRRSRRAGTGSQG